MVNTSLLNTNFVVMLIAGLLHQEISAPDNYPDRPPTFSAPIAQNEQVDQPSLIDFLNVASQGNKLQDNTPSTSSTPEDELIKLNFLPSHRISSNDRVMCKREIAAVFNVNLDVREHVKHAINKLTVKSKLGCYAQSYYNLLHVYLYPGNIPTIWNFCERFQLPEIVFHECMNSIKRAFNAESPKNCLLSAYFYLDEQQIKATENQYVTSYFSLILDRFGLKLKSNNEYQPDYKKPFDYCDSLEHLYDAEIDLNLAL